MRPVKSDRIVTCALGALLVIGTAALFSRSMTLGFVNFDDPAYVVNNVHVQRGLTWEGVRWAFAVDRDFWHPLTWLSLMMDRQISPTGAAVFHTTNVVWHAANALLAFFLMRRLTGSSWWAACSAALFAWHPQRVESVTWITERKDVLSGFFALLAVLAYVRYGDMMREPRARAGALLAYLGAAAAFVCGVMSKSVVVVLPGVFMLLDFWPLGRWGQTGAPGGFWRDGLRLFVEKLPFFLVSLLVGLFTVSTQDASGAFSLSLTFDQRAANAVVSIARYLGMFFWPVGLSAMYPHPGDWPAVAVGASGLLVAGITAFACWSFRERPWLLAGWGWFLAFLLPTLGFVQVGLQAMADRYTYLPMLGVQVVLIGFARERLVRVAPGAGRGVAVAAAVLLGALCARTWDQQAVWRDTDTLFSHALKVTPNNFVAHGAVAMQRLGEGRVTEAVEHAERGIAIAPDSPLAINVLASARLAQGRVDEAVEAFRRVIAAQPRNAVARHDLGQILLRQGRTDEAAELFTQACELRPTYVPARLGLADAALARGRYDVALTELTRALELAPREARVALRIAAVQIRVGRREEAAASLRLACALQPEDVEMQCEAGDALGKLGQFEDARAAYERAVAVAPENASVHARLGYVYFLLKRREDAIRSWERALALDPGMTELHQRIRQARAQAAPGG